MSGAAPLSLGQHLRSVLALGLPLIGGHLAQFAITMTDTLMMGWYSVEALAALVLATMLFFTVFLMGSGFAWAVMPLVANAAARGDEAAVRRTTRMGLWLSMLFAIIAFPLFWWSGPLLRAMGQESTLAADAQAYLRVAGPGLAPALFVMVMKSHLAALERTQIVLWVTVAAAGANAVFDYALIFGNFGAPELGITGAAVASVGTNVLALIGVVLYARRALPEHDLFRRLWRPDAGAFARVFRMGVPIGLTSLAEVGLFAASSVMMGWLGTVPLAAHGIAVQLSSATFMIHLGLSNAATIRAGNACGRGDRAHLLRGAQAVIALSLVTALLAAALFLLWPGPLIGLFLDPADPDRAAILRIGSVLLAIAALFQLVDGAQVTALGLLRGMQDTAVPMGMAAVSYWAIGMPAALVLGFGLSWGGVGVWLGLSLGLAAAAGLMMTRFWRRALDRAAPLLAAR